MGIFSRKRKATPRQLASDIWEILVNMIKYERAKAKEFDRDKFLAEHGFDYDEKKAVEEHMFLYAFLVHTETPRYFFEQGNSILTEFDKIIIENDMEFLLQGVLEYRKAWNEAIARAEQTNDNSTLNDPIYCISKLASIRCFGAKDGIHMFKILHFSFIVNPFGDFLFDIFKKYEVISV